MISEKDISAMVDADFEYIKSLPIKEYKIIYTPYTQFKPILVKIEQPHKQYKKVMNIYSYLAERLIESGLYWKLIR